MDARERELMEARLEEGRHVDKYWEGQISRAEDLGAHRMRERCAVHIESGYSGIPPVEMAAEIRALSLREPGDG